MLRTENIHFAIDKKQILHDVTADFVPGEFSMILGPNGSGKSSFLKIFSGEISAFKGDVKYADRNIKSFKKEELALRRAVMSQLPELSFPLTVEEVVMMGRYPHFKFNPNKHDETICNEVMHQMDLDSFRMRNYLTLSGGEKQRVQFARVLTQIWEKPADGYRYLFLDEPLTSLDIKYQQEFLQIAKNFSKNDTVLIAVMHDINLALQYADKIIFLKEGTIMAQGKPSDILSPALISEVYHVDAQIITHPVTRKPLVIYH